MIETKDDENPEIVYHAPPGSFRRYETQEVRDLAEGRTGPAKGLFKVLVSTKWNRLTFFTMVICFGLIMALSLLLKEKSADLINGVNCEVSAFSYEGRVYSSLTMKVGANNKEPVPVPFEIYFEAINTDNAACDKSELQLIQFNPLAPEPIHVVFSDYDVEMVKCHITSNQEEKILETKVLKK